MPKPSPLSKHRLLYKPKLPAILEDLLFLTSKPQKTAPNDKEKELENLFPKTKGQPILRFEKGQHPIKHKPLTVGVVLSGGQAPGGHNVIAGLFDGLKKMDAKSRLIGFLDGPGGIVKNKYIEIEGELLNQYRNQGGFDLIGSGRTKIETPDQFAAAAETAKSLNLDGLVIIGGDDSNTNAAFLAEYFKEKGIKTNVIGVPKTIDGDLKNEHIEVSFGFDTACKIYSEIIGNILKDALSAKKYYYFIKLMGRSASHITLECALKTHPNMALIGEEIEQTKQSLEQVIQQIADMICQRALKGKHYGTILVSEGIIEFIPEFKQMIQELNVLLAPDKKYASELEQQKDPHKKVEYITSHLKSVAAKCFKKLPNLIQEQLLLDRDPHGNVQVSKIETERLLIDLVEKELQRRRQEGSYEGKFAAQPLFCGYEGRSGLPSNFDCQYCYALGQLAALLIQTNANGYMCCVGQLTKPVHEWTIAGIPIFDMLHVESRGGKSKVVIRKAMVNLEDAPFKEFASQRKHWAIEDDYQCPGPIQFEGPKEITDEVPLTLRLERTNKKG